MQKYFANNYLSLDGTDEETKYWRLRNTFGIDLIEGFKKNAKFGLSAYATHELRRYTQVVDTMLTSQYQPEGLTPFPSFGIDHSKTENLLWVGGQLTKQRGSVLTCSATAQFGLVGPVAGEHRHQRRCEHTFPSFRRHRAHHGRRIFQEHRSAISAKELYFKPFRLEKRFRQDSPRARGRHTRHSTHLGLHFLPVSKTCRTMSISTTTLSLLKRVAACRCCRCA